MTGIVGALMHQSAGYVDAVRAQANDAKLAKALDASSADENAKAVAQDFEAVFLSQMLTSMFEGIETDELFGGGHGEDTFKTLLFDEYGKVLSQAGGIGLASDIQRALLGQQEV